MQWFARMVARFSEWVSRVAAGKQADPGHGWARYFALKEEYEKLSLYDWRFEHTKEFVTDFFAVVESTYTPEEIEAARKALKALTSN